MHRDEFWIALILLGILISKGFLSPVSEKLNRSFLDVPVMPKVESFFETAQKQLDECFRPSFSRDHAVCIRNKPSAVPPLIPSRRAPVRQEWKRG